MISVIMASYNGGKYIEMQLKSIVEQTVRPDEIIIVDDNSTDLTYEYLKLFVAECQVKVEIYRHEENLGYKKTFFDALRRCRGDIICLADQDDIWEMNKIERIVSFFNVHKECLAVNTDYSLIDESGLISKSDYSLGRISKQKRFYNVGIKSVIDYNLAMGCTMVVSGKLKERYLEHFEELSKGKLPHDWILNLLAAKDGGLYFFNEKLIRYRLHGNNTIGLARANTIEKRILDYQDIITQKKEMFSLLELVNADVSLQTYVSTAISNYEVKIKNLYDRDLGTYAVSIIKERLYIHSTWKTLFYDMYLILKHYKEKSDE